MAGALSLENRSSRDPYRMSRERHSACAAQFIRPRQVPLGACAWVKCDRFRLSTGHYECRRAFQEGGQRVKIKKSPSREPPEQRTPGHIIFDDASRDRWRDFLSHEFINKRVEEDDIGRLADAGSFDHPPIVGRVLIHGVEWRAVSPCTARAPRPITR